MRKILLLVFLLSITAAAKAQLFAFGPTWDKGYYYDKNGNKISGLLKNYIGYKTVEFKKDKSAKKIELSVDDIQSFVAFADSTKADSFVVSRSPLAAKSPFVKVILNKPVKLYIFFKSGYSPGANGPTEGVSEYYYYGTDADNLTKLEKKNFVQAMSEIMADKPGIVEQIKKKEFRYGDIKDLLYYYKNGFRLYKETYAY